MADPQDTPETVSGLRLPPPLAKDAPRYGDPAGARRRLRAQLRGYEDPGYNPRGITGEMFRGVPLHRAVTTEHQSLLAAQRGSSYYGAPQYTATTVNPGFFQPGLYRQASFIDAELVAASTYKKWLSGGKGIPRSVYEEAIPWIQARYGKELEAVQSNRGMFPRINVDMPVEHGNRLYFKTSVRQNMAYFDWGGMLDSFHPGSGFDMGGGQWTQPYRSALIGTAKNQMSYRIVGGRVVTSEGSLRQGEALALRASTAILSSREAFGRGMARPIESLLLDISAGHKFAEPTMNLAHDFGSLLQQTAGTASQRFDFLHQVATGKVQFNGKLIPIYSRQVESLYGYMENPNKALREAAKATFEGWSRDVGWNHALDARTVVHEWTRTVHSGLLGGSDFADFRASNFDPKFLYEHLVNQKNGFIDKVYGSTLSELAASKGKVGVEAGRRRLALTVLGDLTMGKVGAELFGAAVSTWPVLKQLEGHAPLLHQIITARNDIERRVGSAADIRAYKGKRASQALLTLFDTPATLSDTVSRNTSVAANAYEPGVLGEWQSAMVKPDFEGELKRVHGRPVPVRQSFAQIRMRQVLAAMDPASRKRVAIKTLKHDLFMPAGRLQDLNSWVTRLDEVGYFRAHFDDLKGKTLEEQQAFKRSLAEDLMMNVMTGQDSPEYLKLAGYDAPIGKTSLSLIEGMPEVADLARSHYTIRGKSKTGYARYNESGDILRMGVPTNDQARHLENIIRNNFAAMGRAVPSRYLLSPDPGSSGGEAGAMSRSLGTALLLPSELMGNPDVAKNVLRQRRDAMLPLKGMLPRSHRMRNPLAYYTHNQTADRAERIRRFGQETFSMRALIVNEGWGSTDAALISEHLWRRMYAAEEPFQLRAAKEGMKTFWSPAVEAARANLGKTDLPVAFAEGVSSTARIDMPLAFLIPGKHEAGFQDLQKRAALYTEMLLSGSEVPEEVQALKSSLPPWIHDVQRRRTPWHQKQIESSVLNQLFNQEVRAGRMQGSVNLESMAYNTRLFLSKQSESELSIVRQYAAITKIVAAHGDFKALAYGVLQGYTHAFPVGPDGKDARDIVLHPWRRGTTSGLQRREALRNVEAARRYLNLVHGNAEGAAWSSRDAVLNSHRKVAAAIASWSRGQAFSENPGYWAEAASVIGLGPEYAQRKRVFGQFGSRYRASYTDDVFQNIFPGKRQGPRGRSAALAYELERGYGRIAYGLGATVEESSRLAAAAIAGQDLQVAIPGLGKVSSKALVELDQRVFRKIETSWGAHFLSGSQVEGRAESLLDPMERAARLRINMASAQEASKILRVPTHDLLRAQVSWQTFYKMADMLLHAKSKAASSAVFNLVDAPVLTMAKDRGVWQRLHQDSLLRKRFVQDLNNLGFDLESIGKDFTIYNLGKNRSDAVPQNEAELISRLFVKHGLLSKYDVDNRQRGFVGGMGMISGQNKAAATTGMAIAEAQIEFYAIQSLASGIGKQDRGTVSAKVMALMARDVSASYKKLAPGLSRKEILEATQGYLLENVRPSENMQRWLHTMAGVAGFDAQTEKWLGHPKASLLGLGRPLGNDFRKLLKGLRQNNIGALGFEAAAAEILTSTGKASMAEVGDADLAMWLKGKFAQHKGGLVLDFAGVNVKDDWGARTLGSLKQRVQAQLGASFSEDDWTSSMQLLERRAKDSGIAISLWDAEDSLGRPKLRNIDKINKQFGTQFSALSSSSLYLNEDTVLKEFFGPTGELELGRMTTGLFSVLRGMGQPETLLSDDHVNAVATALQTQKYGKGAAHDVVASTVIDIMARQSLSMGNALEAIQRENLKFLSDNVGEKLSGSVRQQRGYLAPMLQRGRLMLALEQASAAGYNVEVPMSGNPALVADELVQVGVSAGHQGNLRGVRGRVDLQYVEGKLQVLTYDNDTRDLVQAMISREPTVRERSVIGVLGKVNPMLPSRGMIPADGLVIKDILGGDTDTDMISLMLIGDRTEYLERHLRQAGKLTPELEKSLRNPALRQALVNDAALRVGSNLNNARRQLTDDLVKGFMEEPGKGDLWWDTAARGVRSTLAEMGVTGAGLYDFELSTVRVASANMTREFANLAAIGKGATAEFQNALTGVTDLMVRQQAAAISWAQGMHSSGKSVQAGLGGFFKNFGDKRVLEAYRELNMRSWHDFSQTFIGGKHGYESIVENLLPVLQPGALDEISQAAWQQEAFRNAVQGFIDPAEWQNMARRRQEIAGAFTDVSSIDPTKPVSVEDLKALKKLGAKKGHTREFLNKPLADIDAHIKELGLLNPVVAGADGRAVFGGSWAEMMPTTAQKMGMDVDELSEAVLGAGRSNIRAAADQFERGELKNKFFDTLFRYGSEDPRKFIQEIRTNDLLASKLGFTFSSLGVMSDAWDAIGQGTAYDEGLRHRKGQSMRGLRDRIKSMFKPEYSEDASRAERMAAREHSQDLISLFTSHAAGEMIYPSSGNLETESNFIQDTFRYLINPGLLSRAEQPLAGEVASLAQAQNAENALLGATSGQRLRRPAPASVVMSALSRFKSVETSQGAPLETVSGLAQSAPAAPVAQAVQTASATAGSSERAVAREAQAAIEQTVIASAKRGEKQAWTSWSSLKHNPVFIGAAALAGVSALSSLTPGASYSPDTVGLPRMSRSVTDDYESVVDELQPNPAPVRLAPMQSSQGMRGSFSMRANVDDSSLSTVQRAVAERSESVKLTVRDQSRTQRRWMLRREIDDQMASPH